MNNDNNNINNDSCRSNETYGLESSTETKSDMGGGTATGAFQVTGSARSKHGLQRTNQEFQAKVDMMQGRCTTATQTKGTITASASLVQKQLPRKGLRHAKIQAKVGLAGSTELIQEEDHSNGSIARQAPDTPCGVHDLNGYLDLPSQTSTMLAPNQLNEDSSLGIDNDPEANHTPSTIQAPQYPPSTRNPTSVESSTRNIPPHVGYLVEARAIVEESSRHVLQEAQELDVNQLSEMEELKAARATKEQECQRIRYCLVAVLMIAVVISLGIGLGVGRGDSIITTPTLLPSMYPSNVPSAAPTEYLELLYDNLPDHTQESLQNASTPQWAAWQWLSDHQNISQLSHWKKKQLFALATFFYSFEGTNWPDKIKQEWMDDSVDECFWFSSRYGRFENDGIYQESTASPLPEPCDQNGRFQCLVLANLQLANLTPSVPPEIVLLTSLSCIVLPINSISLPFIDVLPPELIELTNLTSLIFHDNAFRGLIPSELGLLTNLTNLYLATTASLECYPQRWEG